MSDAHATKPSDSAADRLRALWRKGDAPDLDTFLTQFDGLGPGELTSVVRVDQAARWEAGSPVRAEEYLKRFPTIAGHADAALDLIFNEYLLGERRGQTPDTETFVRRFPAHAETLRLQIDLHRAMTTQPTKDFADEPSAKPAPADNFESPPDRLGRYRILSLLGRAGMGSVYAAHDEELGRDVALKIPSIPPGDSSSRQRFRREARIAASLKHPHLCPVYDVGEIGNVLYMTMPVVEGESLAARLRNQGPISPAEAVRLISLVARAVGVAHAAGVVHRDLKPANIMLDTNGEPVVMDFGLASRQTLSERGLTASGVFVGTPAYAAPEQVAAASSATPACDVYALGAILYECLTGSPPFAGPAMELLRQKLTDDPPPPSRLNPHIGGQLDAVCLNALARDPAHRFANMRAFAAAMDSVSAQSVARSALPRRFRKPVAYASACAACMVVAGLLIWQPWKTRAVDGKGPQPPAQPTTVARDPNAAQVIADRAWVLNDSDEMDRAIEECDKALALDDQCIAALMCRANARIKKRLFDPAIADLNRAASLDPKNEMPHVDLAWAVNEIGEYDQAIAHANRAIELKKDSAEAFNQRGWSYFNKRDYRKAVADFTLAIEHDREFINALEHRAAAYTQLDMMEQAVADLKRVDEIKAARAKKSSRAKTRGHRRAQHTATPRPFH
jgi:tetratricopeptide (TPR) repeat protein